MELALYPSLRIAVKVDECRGGLTFPPGSKDRNARHSFDSAPHSKNVSGSSSEVISKLRSVNVRNQTLYFFPSHKLCCWDFHTG